MDIFLFHIALDEILSFALSLLALLWVILLVEYARFWAPIVPSERI
jgi:hypothetical protein